MADTDGLWQGIEAGVGVLPHKVEWFEDDNIGDPAYLRSEIRNTFVVPSHLVDSLGGVRVVWDRAEELAARYGCDLLKANDGSLIFRRR